MTCSFGAKNIGKNLCPKALVARTGQEHLSRELVHARFLGITYSERLSCFDVYYLTDLQLFVLGYLFFFSHVAAERILPRQ